MLLIKLPFMLVMFVITAAFRAVITAIVLLAVFAGVAWWLGG